MAVASKPMKEAKAKASAMPAEPVSPPTRMLLGAKDAPKSKPSGPPPWKITASDTRASDPISSSISTPRTLAPTSTLKADNPSTMTQAISAQAHQDRSMPSLASIWPAITAPKKP